MAFKRHAIIFSEGVPSESLHLGAMALNTITSGQRTEIEAIFPELVKLSDGKMSEKSQTARLCMRRWEAVLLA